MRHVLSLSGGGIRGLIQAVILGGIEEHTGKRTADLFDLIVGTSTGGILAATLTSPKGYSAEDLANMYVNQGKTIFSRSSWKAVKSVGGLLDEKYNFRGLIQVLRQFHGNNSLSSSTVRTMLTSYDVTKQTGRYFKSWRDTIGAVEACRATSAAPTYFEPEQYDGSALIDGGIGVNNPSMSAYAEAKRLFPEEEISLLSIGTGAITRPITYEEAKGWGAVDWVIPLISTMFNAQEKAADYQMRQILGDNYMYLQTDLTDASDDMDDTSTGNLKNLIRVAERIAEENDTAIVNYFSELTNAAG